MKKWFAMLLVLLLMAAIVPGALAAEEDLPYHTRLTRNDLNRLSFIESDDTELWLLPSEKMTGLDSEILEKSYGYALKVAFVNHPIKDAGYYNQATGRLRAMANEWLDLNVYTNGGLAKYASEKGFTAIPDNGDGEIDCTINQSYAIYRVTYKFTYSPYDASVESGIVAVHGAAFMEPVGTFTPTYGSSTHSYARNFNETHHWDECFCGNKVGLRDHVYDNDSDAACFCGYERALYTATVNGGDGSGNYAEGATVSISAQKPPENYVFVNWSSEDGVIFADANAAETTFVMPAHDVTVSAHFRNGNEYAVTIIKNEHSALATDKETALQDDQITLTVVPDEDGYVLVSLTVDGTDVTDQVVDGKYSFSMPAKDVTVEATFKAAPYTITCEGAEHGTISVNKGSYAAKGDTVQVNVVPEDGYELAALEVTDPNGGAVYASSNTFIMPASDVSVKAVFQKKTYTITTLTAMNGTFTVNRKTAAAGETVLVTTAPDNGYTATDVSITAGGRNISETRNGENDFSFTMPASDVTVTVTFAVPDFTVTLENGTKLFNGDRIYAGDQLRMKYTGSGNVSYHWWIPGYMSYSGETYTVNANHFNDSQIIMAYVQDQSNPFLRQINLQYSAGQRPDNEKQYTVNIAPAIEHGRITADKWSTSAGQNVTLTVTPDYGYELGTLSVKQGSTAVPVNNNTFTMPDGDVTVSATFTHDCNGYIALVTGQEPGCTENGWEDYYQCPVCGKTYTDASGTTAITDLQAWKNGNGKIPAAHTGGEATCQSGAICEVCGETYTEKDSSNHVSEEFTYIAQTNKSEHIKQHACCGAVADKFEACALKRTQGEQGIIVSCSLCKRELGQATISAADAPYTGAAYAEDDCLTLKGTSFLEEGSWSIFYMAMEGSELTGGKPVNAGSYYAFISVEADGEYLYAEDVFAITPISIEDAVITVEDTCIYNGTEQKPTNVRINGKLFTADDYEIIGYSNNINAGSNATITIQGKGNYTGEATGTFTIGKATPTVTAPKATADMTYSGFELELVIPGSTTGGTLLYSLDGQTWNEAVPTGIEVGDYTVYYKVDGGSNYESVEAQSLTASIGKADAGVANAPTANDRTYDGTAQPLVTAGSTIAGKMVYSLEENGTYTEDVSTAKNAGTYTVWYYVQGGDNYHDGEKASVKVTIAPIMLEVDTTDAAYAKIYDGTTSVATAEWKQRPFLGDGLLPDAAVQLSMGAFPIYTTSKVGSYDAEIGVELMGDDAPNYRLNTDKVTVTAIIDPKPLTATAMEGARAYNATTDWTTALELDGIIGNDEVRGWAEFTLPGTDVDEYTEATIKAVLELEGADAGNYTIAEEDVTFVKATIFKAAADKWSVDVASPQDVLVGSGLDAVIVPATGTGINGEVVQINRVKVYSDAALQIPATDADISSLLEGESVTLYYVADTKNYESATGSLVLKAIDHQHVWTYAADEDSNTITATCSGTIGTCPDAEQSFTLNAPDAVYSGNPVEAEVNREGMNLTYALHYTGTVYDSEGAPTNAGDYTVTMTVGDKSVSDTFTISPKDISVVASCQFSLTEDTFTYSGKAPVLTVTAVDNSVGSTPLTEGIDYTVGTVQVNAGSHKLTVTGKGNYTGSVELDYSITAKPITIKSAVVADVAYNPAGYTLTVKEVVFEGVVEGENLVTGVDFNATAGLASDNAASDAATATVTVTLTNTNYSLNEKTVDATFAIMQSGTEMTATADKTSYTYGEIITVTGTVKATGTAPAATLTLRSAPAAQQVALFAADGTQLTDPVNVADGAYTLTYNTTDKGILPAASITLTVKFVGDEDMADATANVSIALAEKQLTATEATATTRAYETGNTTVSVTAVTISGVIGTDDVKVDATNLTGEITSADAGTYTSVTLTGLTLSGNDKAFYTITDATVTTSVEITPKEITDPTIVLDASSFVYDGTEKKPAVTSVMDGEDLIDAAEYTVSYANNIEMGTATVTLTDAAGGNYTVSGSTTFQITQSGTAMTAKADKSSYTYGDTITVNGTVKATGTAPAATLTLRSVPAAQQVALFAADGTQLTDPVNMVDGAYTLTYNTTDKGILPAASITLTVKFVGDDNMADQSAAITVALTAKSVEPVLSGSASKEYDGTDKVTDASNLTITLNGIIAGDTVSAAAAGYAYADETVGQSKSITANGITLSGADDIFYTLSQTEASAQIGEIKKAMLIDLTVPANTTLDVYCADADAVIGKLPDTVVYHLSDGNTVDLKVEWSCTAYDNTPGATNAFAWAVSDSEKLACYEIAQNVADDGMVIVTNSAFLPVAVTGTDAAITYNGIAYDVTQMFTIDSNAGTADFEIISGGTGEGTLNGSMLTITKAGTITIKVTTAPNAAYAAGEATAVLTISKGAPDVTVPTGLTAWYGQKLSDIALPTVDGGAWSWTDTNSTVGDAGVQTHQAIFTPANTNLWNITTHPVNITVVQAGTSFGEMKVYNGNAETTTFTYGETITVKAEATAVQPAVFSLRSLIAPAKHQMVLFIRNADGSEVQISEAVNEQNGVYTMTYNTTGKALSIGDNALIAKFVGDENMADYQETVLVTLNPKKLTIVSLTAQDRVYEPGNQQVAITGTEVSGKADANDDVSVLIDGMTATINSENVGTYDTALIPQDVSLTGNHAGYYFARGNVSVSIPQGVEITQATPYTASGAPAQPVFDPIYQDGQTLGDIPVSLPAGTFNVPGNIEWEAPGDTPVTEGTPFTWVFTPDDPNWKPVTGTVVIYPDGELPVITAPAVDQEVTVYEGEQGTMFITAADASSYQWYINRYDGLGYVPISGATSASYTTSVVNLGNDGFTYYCVASNAYGNTESPVFLLQVLEKIEVPETGDESNIALWTALAILSFAGLTIITMNGRRSKITR